MNEYRKNLIDLTVDFLLSCRKLDGIYRIAMIGSLISDKERPKDVDLLITISDQLDLTRLAKISRRLQGKAGQLSSGADVFLTNTQNEYLGRTCIWKDCRFGARLSCDAQNCGKRKYLHDDLIDITLNKDIVENPSLVLCPKVIRNKAIPDDIENGIIKKIFNDIH